MADSYAIEELDDERTFYSDEETCFEYERSFCFTALTAKSKWITKNHKKIRIPLTEPIRFTSSVKGKNEKDALSKIVKNNNCLVYDIQFL